MPNITDANVMRVKTLLKQGKIEDARTQLQRFDDPRAAKLLAQLNKHYPDPNAPIAPISGQEVEQAKALMAKGDYAQAQRILMTSDDPRADVLLKRINETQGGAMLMASPAPSHEKVKAPPAKPSGMSCRTIILLMFVGFAVLTAVTLNTDTYWPEDHVNTPRPATAVPRSQGSSYRTLDTDDPAYLIAESMVLTCTIVYADRDLTSDELYDACIDEAFYAIEHYPAEIAYCFTVETDVADLWTCLADEGVKFSSEYIDEAERS